MENLNSNEFRVDDMIVYRYSDDGYEVCKIIKFTNKTIDLKMRYKDEKCGEVEEIITLEKEEFNNLYHYKYLRLIENECRIARGKEAKYDSIEYK